MTLDLDLELTLEVEAALEISLDLKGNPNPTWICGFGIRITTKIRLRCSHKNDPLNHSQS